MNATNGLNEMRAMLVTRYGKSLTPGLVAKPEPADDEVRIEIRATGINFADLLLVDGSYQEKPQLPFAPGMESCGIVDAVGEHVTEFNPGARVAAFSSYGGLAEYACIPSSQCVAVPDKMPDVVAAGFMVAYGTSHLALTRRANLKPGENLLVLGAAGGIGRTAVEIGKLMGATVVAVASSEEKLKIATQSGAHYAINSNTQDIRKEVKALGGADVVFDPVGGDLFTTSLRSCNPEARLLPVGFASGTVPQIPANILLVKNLSAIGLYWGGYLRFNPDAVKRSLDELFRWYSEGKLFPCVSQVLDLENANEALSLLRKRKSFGKVVVEIGSPGQRNPH